MLGKKDEELGHYGRRTLEVSSYFLLESLPDLTFAEILSYLSIVDKISLFYTSTEEN